MADPADDIKLLPAEFPIALLPVRLETRFVDGPPAELRIRIYPDELAADLHQPALTAEELEAGTTFWLEGWDPANELDAWRRLLARTTSATRAAWIAHALEPTNLALRPGTPPDLRTVELRDRGLPAAASRILPHRWTAVAYQGGVEVARAVSGVVAAPLAMSYTPDLAEGAPELVMRDELAIEPELLWAIDWKAALDVGMGIAMPLTAAQLAQGFDRLLVVGVRTQANAAVAAAELTGMLDAHHYTRGLALVPQGTPTNNTGDAASGYPPPATAERSHAIERAAPALAADGDAELLARALGVPVTTFEHVDGAAAIEQRRARAMNEALWPCTMGYFLQQMMDPLLGPAGIAGARDHFAAYVRGRGPLPAFRVGRVPYGVLPVTPLRNWKSTSGQSAIERTLPQLLVTWRAAFLAKLPEVARIGRTADPDADLLGVLALDASCREIRTRETIGPAYLHNLFHLFGVSPTADAAVRASLVATILAAAGLSGTNPRLAAMTWADEALRIGRPLVTADPLSETATLASNYISALRNANQILGVRRAGQAGEPTDHAPLLHYLLRQGMLVEYGRIGVELAIAHAGANPNERTEAELFRITPGTLARPSPWQRFDAPIATLTGGTPLGTWLLEPSSDPVRAEARAYRDSLAVLEVTPTAELDRLASETLDSCSHRLDAWITSFATRRLAQLRAANSAGTYLGAFAWVENLRRRPGPRPGTTGGYIHAPSPAHAATAAVLRNAHLTRSGAAREQVTIDLSSARVRRALALLDGVREGQPAGAVLGYGFERALHDAAMDVYIAEFRRRYPLARDPAAVVETASERIAARDVVDGLALRAAITGIAPPPWNDQTKLPVIAAAHRPAVAACLAALDAEVDAAADLLVAESVYQAIQGNAEAAGASLATLAGRGTVAPPRIASVPRGGVGFTQRVAIALGVPPAGGVVTARRAAEPRLEAWVASLVGPPADVRCRVITSGMVGHVVSMADLGLGALDLVALARRDGAAELEARLLWYARAVRGVIDPVRVDHTPIWGGSVLGFPDVLEVARLAGELIGASRPLAARDLALPGAVVPAAIDEAELAARAAAVTARLGDVRGGLASALAAAEAAPLPANLDPLRAALWAATAFAGSAAPGSIAGGDAEVRAALAAQARSVGAELDRRAAAAAAATTGLARLDAMFAGELTLLPTFAPPDRPALEAALAYGPALVGEPHAPRRWFERAARVRAPLAALRLTALAAEAVTPARIELEVAQLPHVAGGRWIARPFDRNVPAQRPRPGTCSIALHRAFVVPAGGAWAGLLVDEWAELIPADTQLTAYAVHHDAPGAEAAQCVLLAVPPPGAKYWSLPTLLDTLHETLELAAIRAVDSELIPFGMLAPCIYLADNVADDTVGFDAGRHVIAEAQVLAPE